MQKFIPLAAGASMLAFASAASADDDIKRTYDLTGFDRIEIAGVFELEVTVGPEYSIEISGPEDEVERVEVSVSDAKLRLDQTKRKKRGIRFGGGDDREGVDARITLPALLALDVSGVVDGEVKGLDVDRFDVEISGVGELDLTGACGTLDADVSGVGELNAEELQCNIVSVGVSGVGEALVYAREEVDARVSGMGGITVYGSPEKVTKEGGMFSDITIK